MKRHFLLLLLAMSSFGLGVSQEDFVNIIEQEEKDAIQQYLKDRYWNKSQARYNVAVPKELQQSGSVYLFKETLREYFRNSKNFLRSVHVEHNVIKILSKNGLEDHQIFRYDAIQTDQSVNYNALKIIKPDGRQIIIDVDSIAIIKNDGKVQHKQLVIPNLEVGDIIDYYTYLEFRVLFPQQYSRAFDPVYVLPQSNIPVVDYSLVFTLGPSAFMNVAESNIPAFKKTTFKIDRRTFTRYSLSFKNLKPLPKNTAYFYPFQSLPNLKFQVFVGPYIGDTDIKYNLGGSLKMNTSAHLSRLQDYMVSVLKTNGDKPLLNQFKKSLKKENIDPKRCEPKVVATYLYRYYQKVSSANYILTGSHKAVSDYQFVREFSFLLNRLKIEHDIVIAFNRQLSNIDKFVLTNELNLMIKVRGDDNDMYLSVPNNLSRVDDIPYYFQGTQAYIFNPENRRLTREVIPTKIAQQNKEKVVVALQMLNEDFIKANRTVKATGQSKLHWQNIIELDLENLEPDNKLYRFVEEQNLYKNKQLANWLATYYDVMLERKGIIKDMLFDELSNQIGEIDEGSYRVNILSVGVNKENDSIHLSETFQLEEFGKKANSNLILPLGKFMPIMDEILPNRSFDFYFDFPFKKSYIVKFDVPLDKSVQNLEPFNVEIDNRIGTLSCAAQVIENQLTISLDLSIKSYFEPNKYLADIVEIIESLSEINDSEIILSNRNN